MGTLTHELIHTNTIKHYKKYWYVQKTGSFSNSSVRQKGKSQDEGNEKTNMKIFRKRNLCYPLIRTCTLSEGGRNVCFFGKYDVLCFLVTFVLTFAFFALLSMNFNLECEKTENTSGICCYYGDRLLIK